MKRKLIGFSSVIFLILILAGVNPVSAVLLETTISGEVTKISQSENQLTISPDEVWNGNSWVMYSVTSADSQNIAGEAPKGTIFNYIEEGDQVQATFIGADLNDVTWVTVARVGVPGSSSRFLSDSWGDPANLVSPFFNNFKVSYESVADCSKCTGSVCSAASADVSVSQGWEGQNYLQTKTMKPGETLVFSSPEGCQSDLQVGMVSGQANSGECSGYAEIEGPQAISDFEIHVVQKGTGEEVAVTPASSIMTTTPVPRSPTPTQSPGFVLTAALLGITGALIARRLI